MSDSPNVSRRDFNKQVAGAAIVTAASAMTVPFVHAAESNTINIALIGCGGRGSGAADNALRTQAGPVKLVAMADVFEHKLKGSYEGLKKRYADKVDVPEDRKFLGFDAYKKAMDCLKPGDIAIFATPPGFRWVFFQYAIQKNLHVFMEKPVTIDGPTTRKLFKLAEESEKKNLKVGVGLMIRHCRGRQELHKRIQDGQIGDIVSMRAYRMAGRSGLAGKKPENMSELLYQTQRFHGFLWSGGGIFSDYFIHQIDECSWMKNAWPVKAHATGGRHFRGDSYDQNFDNYSVEYTYPDGTKLFYYGRCADRCHNEFASYVHGAKGSGIVSTSSHTPGRVRLFSGHNMTREEQIWAFPQPEPNPYQMEWDDLMEAIRKDQPYNEARRGAEASLVTSLGRMAAHCGRIVTYDEILNSDHEFAPGLDQITEGSPAPLQLGKDGRYPVPAPGGVREY